MRLEWMGNGGPVWRRAAMRMALGWAVAVVLMGAAAAQQSVTFQGSTFVNHGLVGVGRIPSDARDELGDTLGGLGSAMAMEPKSWKQNEDGSYGGTLVMVPDRGWNNQGKATVDYRGRAQFFDITFRPSTGDSTTAQNQLTMAYRRSVLFHESDDKPEDGQKTDKCDGDSGVDKREGKPTTGFDPPKMRQASSGFPDLPVDDRGRIAVDNEGVVLPGDGTMWISDEYGPYIYHYDGSGRLLKVIRPPDAFIPMRRHANERPQESFAHSAPTDQGNLVSGRQKNQGFEGLAMSPDRHTLFAMLQSALTQDLDARHPETIKHTRRNTRLLAYDLRNEEPKLVAEYAVQLPQFRDRKTGQMLIAAQSDLLALNDTQFLVMARDSDAGFGTSSAESFYRSVDLIDISPATNIAGSKYDSPRNPIAPKGELDGRSIKPALYQKFLDINNDTQLKRFNLHNGKPNDANNLAEKWESLVIVPVLDPSAPHDYFLFVGSDNDFKTQNGCMVGKPYSDEESGVNVDTLVLVFRVTLPTYVPPK
jgi:hypothetical protein